MENSVNTAVLCGYVAEKPTLSHENHGRRFYRFTLEVPRLSGVCDLLPITVGEDLLATTLVEEGERVLVTGQIRTFNNRAPQGRKLIISVFADSLSVCDEDEENSILLTGALCKAPTLRRTPLGRDICDVMLAVSRKYHRTDYIPCILWGTVAQDVASLPVGAKLSLRGRLQSRNYLKVLPEYTEERTAYEVSVMEAEPIWE
ncbi:MAG: single-stranded DNA-binding protein [Oscillospiraceae bacterium]|nr:single-stranded DNA-binding protein [Oscillospiraceae bacterium]